MKRERTRATVATGVGVQHGAGSSSLEHMRALSRGCSPASRVHWLLATSGCPRRLVHFLDWVFSHILHGPCCYIWPVLQLPLSWCLWSGLLVQAVLMPLDCIATRDHKDGCGLCSLWGPCWHLWSVFLPESSVDILGCQCCRLRLIVLVHTTFYPRTSGCLWNGLLPEAMLMFVVSVAGRCQWSELLLEVLFVHRLPHHRGRCTYPPEAMLMFGPRCC